MSPALAFLKELRFPLALARAVLLLAIVATTVTAQSDTFEVLQNTETPSGMTFSGYTFSISRNIARDGIPTLLRVPSPVIIGEGLRLVGWDRNQVLGRYAFSYTVDYADITDSSLVITKSIPRDGAVIISATSAVNSVPKPVFDFSGMYFSFNLTMQIRNSVIQYSGQGNTVPGITIGSTNGASGAEVSEYSDLYVLRISQTGGTCVLDMGAAFQNVTSVRITNHSVVSVTGITARGVSKSIACFRGPLAVTDVSYLRILAGRVERLTVNGVTRTTSSIVSVDGNTVSVAKGSTMVVRSVNAPSSQLLEGSPNPPGDVFQTIVTGNSTITLLDLNVSTLCGMCTSGIPTDAGEGNDAGAVYVGDILIGGLTLDQYQGPPLDGQRINSTLRDMAGRCRSAICLAGNLAVNSNPIFDGTNCFCNCRADTYAPVCLDKFDPVSANLDCDDPLCLECSNNAAFCGLCPVGYVVRNGRCFPILCDVDNCRQCEDGNAQRCILCGVGFGLQADGTCLWCGNPYCVACTATGRCTECLNGYQLSGNPPACLGNNEVCSVANCDRCKANSVLQCEICSVGYSLTSDFSCARCRIPNCLACSQDVNKCERCAAGYTLTQYGTCSPGGQCRAQFCEYCESGNVNRCAQCTTGYIVNPNNGQCVTADTCLVENCHTCQTGTPTACLQCNSGYAVDLATAQCVAVSQQCTVANCAQCVTGRPNVCQLCNKGFTTTPTGMCRVSSGCRVYYCSRCQPGTEVRCQVCWPGYGITTNYLCVKARSSAQGDSAQLPPRSLIGTVLVLLSSLVASLL